MDGRLYLPEKPVPRVSHEAAERDRGDEVIALDQFMQPDPAREESVPVGPVPIRNYPLAKMTALETVAKYGVALLWSNGTEDRPADQWFVRRPLN
jgi:hypothetical protein